MPVMRDHHQRTVKLLQGFGNGFAHFDIEVIGRFIEQQQIGFLPNNECQRETGFFTAGKRRDAGIGLLAAKIEATEEVAHDRHLLKATTDQLWLVADGSVAEFDGDLDDYKQWAKEHVKKAQAQQRRGVSAKKAMEAAPMLEVAAKPKPEAPPADRKDQKRQQAASRQSVANARKPLEQKLAKLETEMKTLTSERDNIVQWLATEEAYAEQSKPRLQEMLKRQGEVVTLLADVEWKWFEVQQKLEESVAS